jgi:SfnB family sulfur acquisition oxidoreductase
MTATAAPHSAHLIGSEAEALSVAREVASRLARGAAERDQTRRVPTPEMDELSASGLLALTVPRTLGGIDVSVETLVKVFQILAAGDPAIAQLPQSHFVFLEALRQDGTAAQQAFFFSQVLAGARFGNAQAERGSNSALDLRTRLRAESAGTFRLNGTKHYCTGALTAHWIPVAALDDDERLVLAYVPRDAPGVEVLADWNAMGQRVTYSGTTHLRNVAVRADWVVPHWRLFERPAVFHPFAQVLHAAIDVGIAQNALEDTIAGIRGRRRPRLGAPAGAAGSDPLLLHRLGQVHAHWRAAQSLLLESARLLDTAGARPTEAAAAEATVVVGEAKAYAEDVAVEIANELFALIGTSATDEGFNYHRHWRNARTHTVHDANQWRYHAAGNWLINGIAPSKPVRKSAAPE